MKSFACTITMYSLILWLYFRVWLVDAKFALDAYRAARRVSKRKVRQIVGEIL